MTKVLKIAGTLRNASSTDPQTWRTLGECVAAMERYPDRYAGVGRVIVKDDPYVGVDLDDVRDPQTGKLSARAAEIVGGLDSYAEVSPSETGVKLWVRASLERAYKKPGFEAYPHGRYFTLTGWAVSQSIPTVEERQCELDALIREEFPGPEEKPRPRRNYGGQPGERIDLVEFVLPLVWRYWGRPRTVLRSGCCALSVPGRGSTPPATGAARGWGSIQSGPSSSTASTRTALAGVGRSSGGK